MSSPPCAHQHRGRPRVGHARDSGLEPSPSRRTHCEVDEALAWTPPGHAGAPPGPMHDGGGTHYPTHGVDLARGRPLSPWRAWLQTPRRKASPASLSSESSLGPEDGLGASSGRVPGLAPRTRLTGQARRAVGTAQMGSLDEDPLTPARASGPKPVQGDMGWGHDLSVRGPLEQSGGLLHSLRRPFGFVSGVVVSWYLWHFLTIEPVPEDPPSTGARKHELRAPSLGQSLQGAHVPVEPTRSLETSSVTASSGHWWLLQPGAREVSLSR